MKRQLNAPGRICRADNPESLCVRPHGVVVSGAVQHGVVQRVECFRMEIQLEATHDGFQVSEAAPSLTRAATRHSSLSNDRSVLKLIFYSLGMSSARKPLISLRVIVGFFKM